MHRKEFLNQCGFACISLIGLSTILESCSHTKIVSSQLTDKRLTVPLSQFTTASNGQTTYRRYIVIRDERLNYPIVVYRQSDMNYVALLLRCTHQQAELNVSGELLTCPAHGSEFNSKGEVMQGPAEAKLQHFPTSLDAQNLFIDLA